MKFTIPGKQLSETLAKVQDATKAKSTLPILECVLISATETGISIQASNLDLSIIAHSDCEVDKQGQCVVSFVRLLKAVQQFGNSDVKFTLGKKGKVEELSIECGKTKLKYLTMSVEEFPTLPEMDAEPQQIAGLLLAVKSVDYCVSSDPTRYILNGVYFSGKEAVATDGRRLSMIPLEVPLDCVLPTGACKALRKLTGERAEVRMGENQAHIKGDGIEIYSKLIEGNFPNFKQVIPDTEEWCRMTINREALIECVKRGSLSCSQENKACKLEFTKEELTVSSVGRGGDSHAQDSIDITGGKELTLALDHEFLLQTLSNTDATDIEMRVNDSRDPVIIIAGEVLNVLMVMMINQ